MGETGRGREQARPAGSPKERDVITEAMWGAILPVGLGALLVIAAMIGSKLPYKFRRRAERFVSYPLLMGVLGGETVWALWTHDSVRAAAFGVPCVLYGALRKPLTDKPDAATAEKPKSPFDRPEERSAPFAELKAQIRG
jgi:hypothetical protein